MTGCKAKVSLIVPVYNVEAYIGKCLESCRAQTLRDMEIICVDDGSTDNSGAILDLFALEDSRVTVIHKENGGLSSARNAGMKIAKGQWIMFLDSDDYLEPNACERVWIESQEEETEIVVFGTRIFPENCKHIDVDWHNYVLKIRTERFYCFNPDILFYIQGAKPFVWRQAFSSALIERLSLEFDEKAKFAEDIIFQFCVFPNANRISFISDTLYNYRVGRAGSLMTNIKEKERAEWHINVIETISKYWTEQGFVELYGTDFLSWILEYSMEVILKLEEKDRQLLLVKLANIVSERELEKYSKELPSDKMMLWRKLKKHSC